MNTFLTQPTPKTPKIELNPDTGIFLFEGRSIPENSIEFYKPIKEWISNYCKSPAGKTIIKINLEYFNTSTSKCLVEIFRILESIMKESKVKIQWFYESEDEDMIDSGEDFKTVVSIPIEFEELKERE